MNENKPSIPNDENLIADLAAPRCVNNDKGFIQLESKLQMRKRQIASTDRADALAVTFAEEVFIDVPEEISTLPPHEQDMYKSLALKDYGMADNEYDVLTHFHGGESV